jgi:hypothetical protein
MALVPKHAFDPPVPALRPGVSLELPDIPDVPPTDLAERMEENRGKYVLLLEMTADQAKKEGDRKTYVSILKFLLLTAMALDKPGPRHMGTIEAESSRDLSGISTEELRELVKP